MTFNLDVPFVPFAVAIVRLAIFEVNDGMDLESCLGTIVLKALKARIASSKTAAAVLSETVEQK